MKSGIITLSQYQQIPVIERHALYGLFAPQGREVVHSGKMNLEKYLVNSKTNTDKWVLAIGKFGHFWKSILGKLSFLTALESNKSKSHDQVKNFAK